MLPTEYDKTMHSNSAHDSFVVFRGGPSRRRDLQAPLKTFKGARTSSIAVTSSEEESSEDGSDSDEDYDVQQDTKRRRLRTGRAAHRTRAVRRIVALASQVFDGASVQGEIHALVVDALR